MERKLTEPIEACQMLYTAADACIDCGACEGGCPVDAIKAE